jgi:hypothetical protein
MAVGADPAHGSHEGGRLRADSAEAAGVFFRGWGCSGWKTALADLPRAMRAISQDVVRTAIDRRLRKTRRTWASASLGTTERCSTPSPLARWRRRQSTDAVIQAGIDNAACCRFDARSRRRASARYGDVLDLVDSTGIAARLERETVAFP